jgi:cobyrinic acid a,c-diamide synthase
MPYLGPRVVIAGTHSGVGKTTVATGLLAALARAGDRPAGAKVGPDFIDPGYHSLACNRPPRNLDPWLCGEENIVSLAARAAEGSDILVVEGVMGLFDGAGDGSTSSTADVASILDAPVVLVVDASAMSSSVAALVHGFASFDRRVRIGGVVLNQVGSPGHEVLLREALESVGVPETGPPITVAVAAGKAFTFTYADTVDALSAAGAEVREFDPLVDCSLPAQADGLIIGGGFPEMYAADLAANKPLLSDIRTRVVGGLPTWAECGGLVVLAESLDGREMAGVLRARASMTDRLTLGYRNVVTNADSPVGVAGTCFRGHEFHYSSIEPAGESLRLESRWGVKDEGWTTPDLLATYVHHHPGGDPARVQAFASRCALRRALRSA